MKGLILKDLYNIKYNKNQMLLMLIVFAIAFLPNGGVTMYIPVCILLCSFMVITTMSFDSTAKWDKYALTMPITRSNIVMSKYLVLFIFSLAGITFSTIVSLLYNIIITKNTNISEMVIIVAISLSISLIGGSFIIPLVYKFGVERARILMLGCCLVPTLMGLIIAKMDSYINFPSLSEPLIKSLMLISPLPSLFVVLISYKICCSIYKKIEL